MSHPDRPGQVTYLRSQHEAGVGTHVDVTLWAALGAAAVLLVTP